MGWNRNKWSTLFIYKVKPNVSWVWYYRKWLMLFYILLATTWKSQQCVCLSILSHFFSIKSIGLYHWVHVKMVDMIPPQKWSHSIFIALWWWAAVKVIDPTYWFIMKNPKWTLNKKKNQAGFNQFWCYKNGVKHYDWWLTLLVMRADVVIGMILPGHYCGDRTLRCDVHLYSGEWFVLKAAMKSLFKIV